MNTFNWFTIIVLFISSNILSQISAPKIYPEANFSSDSIYILLNSDEQIEIHFTTDGSEPTYHSQKYTQPILIKNTTVIRAKCFLSDTVFSKTSTRTYFINENTPLTIVSLSTDPANFFDKDTGIYINYQQPWERPVHMELYEPDRTPGFSIDVGVKMHGEGSRTFPQKSLEIYARKKYGYGKINYQLFPVLSLDEFESIVLRNAGGDWNKSMLRDGLIHTLVKDLNIDNEAYRPAIMFLNGQYWGIHNIRERSTDQLVASHHNIDVDSIDFIKYCFATNGNDKDFMALRDYLSSHNPANQEVYDRLKNWLELDEFLNYITIEVYFDNTDWPGNNIKCWRPRKPGGKWRWILYDTDNSLDMYERESYKHPSLTWACSTRSIDNSNPWWANNVLNGLLKNADFRNEFSNRLADYSNTLFRADNVIKLLDRLKAVIEPEIPRHYARWDTSVTNWYKHIGLIKTFLEKRLPYIQQDYINKLHLKGITKVNLDAAQNNSGRVRINSVDISEFPWTGDYFAGVPVKITAVPLPGFKFVKWKELNSDSITATILPDSIPGKLTAVFEPDVNYSPIVINEINYNSTAGFDTEDWIELFNAGNSPVDVSGWSFRDSDDQNFFYFPQNYIINPGTFVVLCRDTLSFRNYNSQVKNILGNFNFGLNNAGELIRLFNKDMIIVDSLTYDDNPPWPADADGTGKTLELKDPSLENSDPLNWGLSNLYGSPGRKNDINTKVDSELNELPVTTQLYQNYPNPFNPVTVINFSLSERSTFVKLKIFDVLGREVDELINGEMKAGVFKIEWNAENYPSGIYFYRIDTGSYNETRKMILLR